MDMKLSRGIIFLTMVFTLASITPAYTEELPIVITESLQTEISVDIDSPVWEKVKHLTIPLSSQIFEDPKASLLPKKRTTVRSLSVKSVNNGQIIAFLLEWEDATKDLNQQGIDTFMDAAALQFPANNTIDSEIVPSFTMGNAGSPVSIWHWKGGRDSVDVLMAEGFGTLTHQSSMDVKGNGVWHNGRWKVVFSKRMNGKDGVVFIKGKSLFIAFAIWDGSNMERDGQKSITTWYRLKVE